MHVTHLLRLTPRGVRLPSNIYNFWFVFNHRIEFPRREIVDMGNGGMKLIPTFS